MPLDLAGLERFFQSISLFRYLTPEQLHQVAEAVEVIPIENGYKIFVEGGEADCLYFIHSGKVKITRKNATQAILEEGDFFGQEILENFHHRRQTAIAINNVVLLRMPHKRLDHLAKGIPDLKKGIDLEIRSQRLARQRPMDWRNPDENLIFIARKHVFFLWSTLIAPVFIFLFSLVGMAVFLAQAGPFTGLAVALLAMLMVCSVGWAVWRGVDWGNDFYIITSQRVVYLEKVILIHDSRQEVPLDAVLSVTTQTSQMGRVFSFGDVIVHSYTGTLRLKHLPDSQLVLALIEERMARQRKQQQRSERQSIEQTLRIQMGQAQSADTNSQTVVREARIQSKPGLLKTFWDETFSLCFQQDDVITYRKHWWILVAYIWKQTLLLLLILAAFIGLLLGHLTLLPPTFLGILLCLAALFIFGWWVYKFVDWQNDQFLITSEQVIDIDKKPLGREERRAAPLKSIQSIEYQRIGFIGLLLNFGTVFIRIGDTEFSFDFVSNPSEVQRELFQRLTDYQNRQKKEALDAENQRMAEWIQIYHNLNNNNSVDKPDTEDWL